jgi:DNA-binding MarR family transcriptional regulator
MVKHGTIRLESVSLPKRPEPQMPVYLNQDDALAIWRDALSASVRSDGPDLSSRQMAILMTVYTQSPPHTVRGLSDSLNISKPAISRALDRLGQLGFVRRRRDDYDRRSVQVQRTVKGAVFLSEFADLVSEAGRELESPTPFEAGTPAEQLLSDEEF